MRKMLAVLMTFSMVLAGCMDLTDEDLESIVDGLVDLPGCNDETAYNYDENATNNLACLTEQVLKQSVTDFVNLVDNGPAWNETMGMMMEGSETDSDGMTTTFTTTTAVSPDGMYLMTEMDMGMMIIEIGELMTENADGTTNIQTTWMGNTFQMNTEAVFDDHWNEQSFLEDDDDMGDDGMDMGDDGMDMGDDDMDMGLPNTEVEIPNDFDPATALYTAGLSTSNGYSFTTTLEHEGDYTTTMTFTLSTDLAVTSLVMVESYDGMTSTSSITILDAEAADQLLVNDETLVEHALPFTLSPMGGDDHDGHDHGDHDDHDGDDGDHDGHDHGDEITSLEDFDVSSWDSTNDLQQIVDWFNDNYMYEEDETLMQVGDFLSLCDADPDYVDNYVAECVFNSAMNMLHNDDHDGHDHGDDDGDHDDHDDDLITPEQLLADIDSDESGTMSLDEFNAFFGGSEEIDVNDPEFSDIFDNNDADASGDLDSYELEGFIMELDAYLEGGHDGHDHGDDDGHDDGHDDHDMMIYECLFIVATDSIVNDENGQPDFASSWDGTNLDTTLCDTVVENHDDYYINFEEGTLELPTELYVWDLDEEDGDMVMLMDLISDNGITITMDGLPVDECEGTFNADENSCTMETGTTVVASNDSMMIWLNSEEGEEMIVLYQFDSTTNSGVMMGLVTEDDDHDDHDDNDDHDDDNGDMSEADAWTHIDADGDGYATVSEIVNGLNSMDAPSPEGAMEDADTDNSGGVSWDEFVTEWNSEEDEGSDEHLDNNAQLASDLHAAFNSSDADNDDNLSIDELGSFIDQVITLATTEEDIAEITGFVQRIVNCVDTDEDGVLDEMEFSEFYMMLDEELFMSFCMFDTNNDGLMTASEYASFINDTMFDGDGPMTEDDWQMVVDMIGMYDLDDNGGLDAYEFDMWMEDMDDGHSDGVYWEPYHGGYCEWEGNPDDEQDVWSCKDDASDSDWDDWWYYCELHGEDWYCTDDYGQDSEYEYSSSNTNYDHNGHDDHDGHDHDGHDDHMMAYDWMINTADMMSETEVIGAYADYHIVLANCVSESSDDMMGGETLSCGDDVLKVTIAEATAPGAEIMFHDADMSGTITAGDMIHINPDIDAGGEWNTVRLYSVDADKYSDENPMMTPGFGAFAGIVALLGAALLTRRD